MMCNQRLRHFARAISISALLAPIAMALPRFPVGMNLPSLNYYGEGVIFNNVMTTASDWVTFYEGSAWNTNVRGLLELDTNGYPVELPQTIDGHGTMVRFLINNNYVGRYRVLWDGAGELEWNLAHEEAGGKHYVTFDGQGGHKWITIRSSARGNHVRNIRIIPEALEDTYDPANPEHLFNPDFVAGLRPFHALRFMDWLATNGSTLQRWEDRTSPTQYSQGTGGGVCIEYAIELCNYLGMDGWFCVPHGADDDCIRKFARLVRDNLNPSLTVYVEYSNEVWNWGFAQAQWACRNGQWDGSDIKSSTALRDALRQLGQDYCGNATDECVCHPEKDAYLMSRTFKIWKDEFDAEGQGDRLVRVAAIQVGWCDNSNRVLAVLENNGGCDALSPTMYFNFSEAQHNAWNAMDSADVTAGMIIDSMSARMDQPGYFDCVATTARQAQDYGLDIVVYEAGQHMQPWQQGEWGYNHAVWDAQIHQGMYELYMKNWGICDSLYQAAGGIRLNCAFSYVGARQSRYGSWGHLEDLQQLDSIENIRHIAPKYAALLDVNAPRPSSTRPHPAVARARVPGGVDIVQRGSMVFFASADGSAVTFAVYTTAGRTVMLCRNVTAEKACIDLKTLGLATGLYLCRANCRGASLVKNAIIAW